ncbi:hypothetical protein PoB_006537800 [Plakobranchus ocellatus]|uniref:TNFR-Cys domain-containing protein n=1 Tax=Plakobranchus ocellatus TaxID=259542 RepID=A0AAV4D4B4_9GAST|nr:hypothetical protein PoB_006537800 [Plakobranchus ocellatus]
MVCQAMIKFVGFFIAINLAFAGKPCTGSNFCDEGEECDGENCLPCEVGYFREDFSHRFKDCKPWKNKPPGPGWIVSKNGTRSSDRVWSCQEGYKIYYTTPDDAFCSEVKEKDKITLQPNMTTSSEKNENKKRNESGNKNLKIVLGSVFGSVLVIGLIVSFFVFRYCRARGKNNHPKDGDANENGEIDPCLQNGEPSHKDNENHESQSPVSYKESTISCKNDSITRTQTHGNECPQSVALSRLANFFAKNLELEHFYRMLLELSSEKFNSRTHLSYELEKSASPIKPYIETFIEWGEKNSETSLVHAVTDAVKKIGNAEILENPEFQEILKKLDLVDISEFITETEL